VALVVLLRGVNVGGHRTFRPSVLAAQLARLDVVNIGAAGTFVVRRPIARATLREEVRRRLPFATDVMICHARDFVRLVTRDPFADEPGAPDVVRFVSVLAARPRNTPALPIALPAPDGWLLKVVAREDRFVLGVYRRHMRAIGYLGTIDRIFGVPATTRNWHTIAAIANAARGKRVADARKR
jgi:uncharacterized protein (DUF1697 family)